MARRLERPAQDDIVAIQLLRWIAASLVVWVHSEHELSKVAARHHRALRFSHAVEFGVGVDIFFLISGFLIFLVSRDLFGRPGAGRDFIIRRMVRILPLYWVATASMLVAILSVPRLLNHASLRPTSAIASFLMIAWPDRRDGVFPLLASGWTLNLEFYFYALFALVLGLPARRAVPILIGVLLSTVALDQAWSGSPWWLDFYAQPIVLEFGAGMLLCLLYTRGTRLPLIGAIAGIGLAIALHLGLRAAFHPPRVIGNGIPALLLFVSSVFAAGVRVPRAAVRPIRLMGNASYALYLTSPFTINATIEVLTRRGVQGTTALTLSAYLASLAAAVVVHRVVERPLTASCRRAVGRTRVRIPFGPVAEQRGAAAT